MTRPEFWFLTLLLTTLVACGNPRARELARLPTPPLTEIEPASREIHDELRRKVEAAGSDEAAGAAWGALAQWHEAHGFGAAATTAYAQASRYAPRDARWPYHLGRLAARAGDRADAARFWRRTLELAPRHLATTVRLAELLASTEPREAELLFRQALEVGPGSARVRVGLAEIFRQQGRTGEAIAQLQRALAIEPRASSPRYQLGILLRDAGRVDEANQELSKVPGSQTDQVPVTLEDPWLAEIDQFKVSSVALQQRGLAALAQGRLAEAVDLLRRAVGQSPDNLKARHNLATALSRQGRVREAIVEVEAALSRDPDRPGLLNTLATLRLRAGEPRTAEESLLRALEVDPEHDLATHNLALLLLHSGRPAEALPQFERAVALEPTRWESRHGRALALWHTGAHGIAITTLARDLLAHPRRPELSSLLARLLAAEGETQALDEAWLLLEDLSAVDPPNVAIAETRAAVLAALDRFESAESWQRAAHDALAKTRRRRARIVAADRLRAYERRLANPVPWALDETYLPLAVTPPAPAD